MSLTPLPNKLISQQQISKSNTYSEFDPNEASAIIMQTPKKKEEALKKQNLNDSFSGSQSMMSRQSKR